MIDVAHSVSLDQRLDCPHDPVSFPQYSNNPTPATFAVNTPSAFSANQQILESAFAPFGGFDLSGEPLSFEVVRPSISVNLFEPQNWHAILAVMNFQLHPQQQSDQDLSHSPQQHSRQFNDMATYHQYSSVDVQQSMLQPPATPPFVEPSANYFAIPTTATSNLPLQSSPYFNNSTLSATLPTANNINNVQNSSSNNLTTNNASVTNSRGYSNPSGISHHNFQHHPHNDTPIMSSQRTIGMSSQLLAANSYGQGNQSNADYNGNHFISQRTIYNSAVPATIHRQKSIPRTINTNLPQSPQNSYSRPNSATTSPINSSIAPPIFTHQTIAQTLNNNNNNNDGHGNNTMHLPMFESNNNLTTAWTTKPPTITIPTTQSDSSSKTTSPTTPTYSYSGPPKSYYSRLPLYDRPFKCDQCPQSFNRNHDLKRHKRIHLAVKPYPCPYCEKQFSRKDALKRHILVKGCNNTINKSESLSTNVTGNDQIIGESLSNSRRKYDTPIENYVDNRIP